MLALPKGRFFCFLHYRYWPLYVQLFIFNFLCICLLLFGTLFSAVPVSNPFFRWPFSAVVKSSTGASHWPNRGCLGLRRCHFPTWLPKSHTGASLFFLPRTSSPLPLKGEGQDFAHLWGFGFSLAVALATAGHNRATLAQQGRSGGFGGVAPLLGPQNRTQGHTGASLVLACWLAILRKIAFRNPV